MRTPVERAARAIERVREDLEQSGVPAYTVVAFTADGGSYLGPLVVAKPELARTQAEAMAGQNAEDEVYIVGRKVSSGRVSMTVWEASSEHPLHLQYEVMPDQA